MSSNMAQLSKQPSSRKPVLYLSNLPYGAAASQIADAFHEHAHVEVEHVELLKKGHDGFMKTCGLGAVTLQNGADVDGIIRTMDGYDMMGRPMIVRKDRFVEDTGSYHAAGAGGTR